MNLPFALGPDARAARDGCGCPRWVRRCVHFDGEIMILIADSPSPCECPIHLETPAHFGIAVIKPQAFAACPVCGTPDAGIDGKFSKSQVGYFTEAEAFDAFGRVEARFVGKGGAS